MTFSIRDFKTGQKINTPAKIKLWEYIINRTFGGLDCAMKQYEKYSMNGNWQSYQINGMIQYLDELTGGDYGTNHPKIQSTAGTLAVQFKKKFNSICYLMSNNTTLDQQFNIAPIKAKEVKQSFDIKIDYSKSYAILGELYSKNLSTDETRFIAETLMNNCKK